MSSSTLSPPWNVSLPQKLPFTIPELVHASPCRSSDGVFYTGKHLSSPSLWGRPSTRDGDLGPDGPHTFSRPS